MAADMKPVTFIEFATNRIAPPEPEDPEIVRKTMPPKHVLVAVEPFARSEPETLILEDDAIVIAPPPPPPATGARSKKLAQPDADAPPPPDPPMFGKRLDGPTHCPPPQFPFWQNESGAWPPGPAP